MPSKLQKFAEFKKLPGCFTYVYEDKLKGAFPLQGKWNTEVFRRNAPVVLELGCGYGEYTIGLAKKYPENNYIGIDRKSNRMWTGAIRAFQENIFQVAFLRTQVEFLPDCFAENEVSSIWLTFPDPHEPKSKEKKRLTSPRFLELYNKILTPEGIIHLKTDNTILFEYTLKVLEKNMLPVLFSSDNVYVTQPKNSQEAEWINTATSIQTRYEKMFSALGHSIKYLVFRLS
jgi:tRNA (guanine-N7-)-methyltransferase